MNITEIEWVANPDGSRPGWSWNPLTGCFGPGGTAEDPHRCSWCYAWRLATGRLRSWYLANTQVLAGNALDPFAIRFWPKRLSEPRRQGQPRGIFVCDMGDLFGPWGDIKVRGKTAVEWVMEQVAGSRHRFYFLTKWPERLRLYNPWPDNIWIGASATNAQQWRAAVDGLAKVKARIRFISAEPWLGDMRARSSDWQHVNWLIVGGLTGPYGAVPPRAQVEQLLVGAREAGVPRFLKNNLVVLGPQFPREQVWPDG